jgi:hypothetical protein
VLLVVDQSVVKCWQPACLASAVRISRTFFKHWLARVAAALGLVSAPVFAATVSLEWDPSADPEFVGYNVYVAPVSGGATNKLDVGVTPVATIQNLQEGETYQFFVTARNSAGIESDPSNEVEYFVPIANQPPTMGWLPNQFVEAGGSLSFPVTAFDNESSSVAFSLGAGAPVGAVIDPMSGVFSWTPPVAQVLKTNWISIIVTDSGTAPQKATGTFMIVTAPAGEYFALQIGGFLNGKVQRTIRGIMSASGEAFPTGTSVTLTASPRPGYMLAGWMLDGQLLPGDPLTISMTKNMRVTPIFRSTSITLANLVTPQISMAMGIFDGKPSLSVGGELGAWVLEGSSNLKDWVVAGAGLTSEEVELDTTAPFGFYRVRSRPLAGIL